MEKVEEFIRNAEPARLTAKERALIRARLSASMDSRPIWSERPVASPYVVRSSWFEAFRTSYATVAAILVMVAGGGLTAVANGALPGEPLYAVKVKFNEQVAGMLAFTPEQRAEREADLAERRLMEAADLSVQGRLTTETRAQLETDIKGHLENVEREVGELSRADARAAVTVNSELESSLRVHEKMLAQLSARSHEAGTLASSIRQELTVVSQSLNTLEKSLGNEVSPEAERQARAKSIKAEERLNEARDLVRANANIDPKDLKDAERGIGRALAAMSEGYQSIENGSFNKAFFLFQRAIRFSAEATLTVEASKEIKAKAAAKPAVPPKATTTPATTDTASSTASTASTTNPSLAPAASTTASTSINIIQAVKAPVERSFRPQTTTGIRSFLKLGEL